MEGITNYIVWDLETSGLLPGVDRILEIGATAVVRALDGDIFENNHGALLNHGIEIPELITKITGLTKEKLASDGVIPYKALSDLVERLEFHPVNVTHNGFRFDIPFLMGELRRFEAFDPARIEALEQKLYAGGIDTAVLFKAKKLGLTRGAEESMKQFADRVMSIRAFGLKYNVGVCCDELGIDRSATVQHRAGGDVFLTNEIFKKITQAV